jgi:hypothetical protein
MADSPAEHSRETSLGRQPSSARQKALIFLAVILVILALWLSRSRGLDGDATIDEARWLLRSVNFYQALASDDLRYTFQREHPGVTITWAGAAGFLRRYPGYAAEAGEQMPGPTRLQRFLRQHKHSPLELLAEGRRFVTAAIVAVLALAFVPAVRLLGLLPALLGFLFIAGDPFLASLSRLLHLDGLVSALMLACVLWFADYLYRGRGRLSLVLSGAAAGLSWLTKSPALFLAPYVSLMALEDLLRARKGLKSLRWSDGWAFIHPLLVWTGVAVGVFVLFWPAMWVEPLGTLQRMFSQALEYTVEGNRNAIFFNGQVFAGGASAWFYYPVAYLWRVSPLVLLGLGLAILALIFRRRLELPALQVRLIAVLLLFAVAYTVFMSFGGQKYDRYLLPVFAPLDLAAGWGWFVLLNSLVWRFDRRFSHMAVGALAAGLVLIQALGLAQSYPYYYTYFNPLLGGLKSAGNVMMLGWGEGLEQAASYINSLPGAGGLRVAAWYGDIFTFFFRGVTDVIDENTTLADLQGADYAVVYVQQVQRQVPSPEFLAYFTRLTPEYTVRIDGVDYAWVYKLNEAPPD